MSTVASQNNHSVTTADLRASLVAGRTVSAMTWMVSSPTADGSVLLVNLPEGAAVHATFSDTGEERDITAWTADLILIGLAARTARTGWGDSIEVERVQVANVSLIGSEDFEVVFAHPSTGVTATYHWQDGAELLAEGIAEQLTAAVASDNAEIPDSFPVLPSTDPAQSPEN
jgi:hypothetical protein